MTVEERLRQALTGTHLYTDMVPEGSIMDSICDHDTNFLCEHRREWVIEFLKSQGLDLAKELAL